MLNKRRMIGCSVGLAATILIGAIEAYAPTKYEFQPSHVTQAAILAKADPVCHHAVVCGGIHSVQDITRSKGTWPTFDIRTAKHFNLPYGIWGYVTYRDDQGRIQVSHVRREIPKGTEVFEDAFGHIILARCGNAIVDGTNVGAMESEPSEPSDVFPPILRDGGEEQVQALPIDPTAPGTDSEPPTTTGYPSTPSSPTPCCGIGIQPRTPISVGEPGELELLGIGFIGLCGVFSLIGRKR